MALSPPRVVPLGLGLLLALSAIRQTTGAAPEQAQGPQSLAANLSPECRVPASQLYDLAPLQWVKAALEQNRPLKVLALGPASASGVSQGGTLAPYPVRLERELEKVLPGVDVTVLGRSLPGDVTAQAVGTIMNIAGETEPDLVVWQVGIDDALAQAEIAPFAEALARLLRGFAPMRSTPYWWSLPTNGSGDRRTFYRVVSRHQNRRPRERGPANPSLGGDALSVRAEDRSCAEPLRPAESRVPLHRRACGSHGNVVAERCRDA